MRSRNKQQTSMCVCVKDTVLTNKYKGCALSWSESI